MKKYLTILSMYLLFSANSVFAQDDEIDNLDFEMQNYEQFEEDATPYFVIGGGAVMNMMFLDYTDINAIIKVNKFNPGADKFELSGPMYLFGAQGMVAVGLIPNVRVGVIGMSGSTSPSNTVFDTLPAGIFERDFKYEVGFTGINIDYAWVPFHGVRFAVVPGVILGWGSMTMESFQTATSGLELTDFTLNDNLNRSAKLESSYWYAAPMLNLEYAPTVLSLFRVSVGYSLSFGQKWTLNGNPNTKIDVSSNIGANGLTLQFGIIFGLFNY